MLSAMPALPRLPKVPRTLPKSMTDADAIRILAAASDTGKVAIALAYYGGFRANEVRGLRWSDVDFKTGFITVRRGICGGEEAPPKSHAERQVPMAGPLRALLEPRSKKKPSPWAPVAITAFGKPWGDHGLRQMFERAQKRAGLEGWTFHSLRHGFATTLFRRGAAAPVVQKLLGHADLKTTQIYCDLVAADLKAAVALFGGDKVETA
jgi:integrase